MLFTQTQQIIQGESVSMLTIKNEWVNNHCHFILAFNLASDLLANANGL